MSKTYERLAKCTCGSMLLWGYHDVYGNTWLHWRPTDESIAYTEPHMMIEGTDFYVSEEGFQSWNEKSPEELKECMTTMDDFWQVILKENK